MTIFLATAQGYQAINSSAPTAQLSATDQMMYAAFPTKAPSMKQAPQKVLFLENHNPKSYFFHLYFQIYPGFSPSPSVKGYSQGPPVYAHQGSYIVQQGYPGKGAESDVSVM